MVLQDTLVVHFLLHWAPAAAEVVPGMAGFPVSDMACLPQLADVGVSVRDSRPRHSQSARSRSTPPALRLRSCPSPPRVPSSQVLSGASCCRARAARSTTVDCDDCRAPWSSVPMVRAHLSAPCKLRRTAAQRGVRSQRARLGGSCLVACCGWRPCGRGSDRYRSRGCPWQRLSCMSRDQISQRDTSYDCATHLIHIG